MRLLFVTDHLSPHGAQRQLVTLAVELASRGHELGMFLYHSADFFDDRLQAAGVDVLRQVKPYRFSPAPVRALKKHFRSGRWDVVLAFLPTPSLYCILARGLHHQEPRLGVSERSSYLNPRYGRTWRFISRLYRRADHLVTNSYSMQEYFATRFPDSQKHISTIWNGVDLDLFSASPSPSRSNGLRLLGVGRIAEHKNCLVLAEALGRLRRQGNDHVQVTWVGDLPGSASRTERSYQRCVNDVLRSQGVEAQWTWRSEGLDMAELLRDHHALVHPSYVEGLPNVVCESLACGRPALVSDTLDHPRLVQPDKTGWLFDWRDPDSLAEAITQLDTAEPQQIEAMGQRTRTFAEEHLSSARCADQYEEIFQRLLDTDPR